MTSARVPRWALSFADLCLLLLGFFVILHAQRDPRQIAGQMRAAFGDQAPARTRTDYLAAALFEPGEAVLRRSAAPWLARTGREAARAGEEVLIVSEGMDPASARLDGWELAAARAAAIGRALRSAGLDERRVTISIPSIGGAAAPGQTLRITRVPAAGALLAQ